MSNDDAEWKSAVGQRLELVRGASTQARFAELLGINVKTLGFYERGIRAPEFGVLLRLKDKFGVNLNWLATGLGDMFGDIPLSAAEWDEIREVINVTVAMERPGAAQRAAIIYNYLRNIIDDAARRGKTGGAEGGAGNVDGSSETGNRKNTA